MKTVYNLPTITRWTDWPAREIWSWLLRWVVSIREFRFIKKYQGVQMRDHLFFFCSLSLLPFFVSFSLFLYQPTYLSSTYYEQFLCRSRTRYEQAGKLSTLFTEEWRHIKRYDMAINFGGRCWRIFRQELSFDQEDFGSCITWKLKT